MKNVTYHAEKITSYSTPNPTGSKCSDTFMFNYILRWASPK